MILLYNTVYMYSVSKIPPIEPIKGRGSSSNIEHRFLQRRVMPTLGESANQDQPETTVSPVQARSIISRNASPDVGFNLSVNPYQGCEHGCVYCFARPTHAYLDLSPGLDFETRINAKINAPELLRKELSNRHYQCEPIAIGVNTDAYQPIERDLQITRKLLEVCLEFRQPVGLLTKSKLILRDLDLLRELAAHNLVKTAISVTTLNDHLKRIMEPRASNASSRLKTIEQLSEAGVSVGVMVAPVIPRINDHELEKILAAVSERGAHTASYVLLRLPHEVDPLFRTWLHNHFPQRQAAVMKAIESCRGGKSYDSTFYKRMRGEGLIARMIARRFKLALKKHRLDGKQAALATDQFRVADDHQMELF